MRSVSEIPWSLVVLSTIRWAKLRRQEVSYRHTIFTAVEELGVEGVDILPLSLP